MEVDGTSVTTTAVPFPELLKALKEKFGDLGTRGLQIALKHSETIDISGTTKYKITYGGNVYDITSIEKYFMKDVVLAFVADISKRHD